MNEKDSVLIVGDDRNLYESLSLTIDIKGYEVDMALTAKEAIEKVEGRWFGEWWCSVVSYLDGVLGLGLICKGICCVRLYLLLAGSGRSATGPVVWC